MPEITHLKTECQHCKGHIEYPSGLAGQSVECPHCKRTTTLLSTPPPPIPPPLPVIQRARASIEKASSFAGVGCLLQGVGAVCFVLAILTVKTAILPVFLASSDFGSCSTVAGWRPGISARRAVVSYRTPVWAFVRTATRVFVSDDFCTRLRSPTAQRVDLISDALAYRLPGFHLTHSANVVRPYIVCRMREVLIPRCRQFQRFLLPN
jgi:hypothetical protein